MLLIKKKLYDDNNDSSVDAVQTALAGKSAVKKYFGSRTSHSCNAMKDPKLDVIEKMKSLSEYVNKMSVKDRSTDLPLSPNSNKENIPFQAKQPQTGMTVTAGLPLAELAKMHESQSQLSKTSVVGNAKKDITKKPPVSLAVLSSINEKFKDANPKPSLAELALSHQSNAQSVKPGAIITDGAEEKMDKPKPSLSELIAKHESQAGQKANLANLVMKSADSSKVGALLQDVCNEVKSDKKESLLSLAHDHEKQTGLPSDQKKKDAQTCIIQSTPSLSDLANEFQQPKKIGLSLSELATKESVKRNESIVTKPSVSLADLARKKGTNSNEPKDITKEVDSSINTSLKKLAVSDRLNKSIVTGIDKDDQKHEVSKDFKREFLRENFDNLMLSQASKFATHASLLGKTLCLKVRVKKACKFRKCETKRFSYQSQIKGNDKKTPELLRKIIPYDFSDPSPDDIVKQRQKAAFSRTGERKISDWVVESDKQNSSV